MSSYSENFKTYLDKCDKAKAAADRGDLATAVSYYEDALEYSDKLQKSPKADERDLRDLAARDVQIIEFIKSVKYPPKKVSTSNRVGNDEKFKRKSWFDAEIPSCDLSDVQGMRDVIEQFNADIIVPLNYPDVYAKYSKDIGSRVLLYGPPGTGKTFVVRCLAGHLRCKIAVIQVQDILDKYVGEAEGKIKEIFAEADTYERSLIFFDEIDSIASDRDSDDSRNTKGVLTALLTEMDGFASKKQQNKFKIIIAATNKPWALDAAIRRGGRFDTQIYVGPPDKDATLGMIKRAFMLNNDINHPQYPPIENNDPDTLFEKMAQILCHGYGGGDIVAICKRIAKLAGLASVKTGRDFAISFDFCSEIICATPPTITPEMEQQFLNYSKGKK